MPEREHVVAVVREWAQKAENDLKTAAYTLTMPGDCPTDTVCFHAQQAAEKYVKALLVWEGVDFPKTHDLGRLVGLLPLKVCADISAEDRQRLTTYATAARYPGGLAPVSLGEARRAVRIARRVRREIRNLLPREALRRSKRSIEPGVDRKP